MKIVNSFKNLEHLDLVRSRGFRDDYKLFLSELKSIRLEYLNKLDDYHWSPQLTLDSPKFSKITLWECYCLLNIKVLAFLLIEKSPMLNSPQKTATQLGDLFNHQNRLLIV